MATEPKFVVGDTLVTARYDEDSNTFVVTDGQDEWRADVLMMHEHYEPVSQTAMLQLDRADNRQD